jgi:hypothetical protein
VTTLASGKRTSVAWGMVDKKLFPLEQQVKERK